jgi:hypothetical protein
MNPKTKEDEAMRETIEREIRGKADVSNRDEYCDTGEGARVLLLKQYARQPGGATSTIRATLNPLDTLYSGIRLSPIPVAVFVCCYSWPLAAHRLNAEPFRSDELC